MTRSHIPHNAEARSDAASAALGVPFWVVFARHYAKAQKRIWIWLGLLWCVGSILLSVSMVVTLRDRREPMLGYVLVGAGVVTAIVLLIALFQLFHDAIRASWPNLENSARAWSAFVHAAYTRVHADYQDAPATLPVAYGFEVSPRLRPVILFRLPSAIALATPELDQPHSQDSSPYVVPGLDCLRLMCMQGGSLQDTPSVALTTLPLHDTDCVIAPSQKTDVTGILATLFFGFLGGLVLMGMNQTQVAELGGKVVLARITSGLSNPLVIAVGTTRYTDNTTACAKLFGKAD